MSNNYWGGSQPPDYQNPDQHPYQNGSGYTNPGDAYSYRATSDQIIQDQPAYGSYYAAPPKPEKQKKEKKKNGIGKSILLVAICLVISFAGGYAGSLAGRSGTPAADPAASTGEDGASVFYQAVDRVTDSTGNEPLTTSDVVSMIKDSVVEVTTEEMSTGYFFQQYVTTGAGSGVIISTDGYIVTCAHVVNGASGIKVKLNDGTELSAELVGLDERTDLAVLKVEATGLTPAVIGDSDALVIGEGAVVIGNPLGSLGGTVTTGIISALGREVVVENQTMTLLQTNAAVNPGNSGGGIFNMQGDLIGIVNAKSSGGEIEGLGFAIPSNTMKTVVEQLIESGYVPGRPALGVEVITIATQQDAADYNVDRFGVYIMNVTPGKGAEAAGLQPGDYILSVDGTVVNENNDVLNALGRFSVGDTVRLEIIRDGKTLTFDVALGESAG